MVFCTAALSSSSANSMHVRKGPRLSPRHPVVLAGPHSDSPYPLCTLTGLARVPPHPPEHGDWAKRGTPPKQKLSKSTLVIVGMDAETKLSLLLDGELG